MDIFLAYTNHFDLTVFSYFNEDAESNFSQTWLRDCRQTLLPMLVKLSESINY